MSLTCCPVKVACPVIGAGPVVLTGLPPTAARLLAHRHPNVAVGADFSHVLNTQSASHNYANMWRTQITFFYSHGFWLCTLSIFLQKRHPKVAVCTDFSHILNTRSQHHTIMQTDNKPELHSFTVFDHAHCPYFCKSRLCVRVSGGLIKSAILFNKTLWQNL